MKIRVGHLFYDLLNLYGESGNVIAMKKALEEQGIEVEERCLSIADKNWNLDDLDFIYMGAGTQNNLMLALDYLENYKEKIKELIEKDKFFLVTGNAISLFGKSIKINEEEKEALSIFDFHIEDIEERFVSECIFEYDKLDKKVIGFENYQGKIVNNNLAWFNVEKGYGTNENSGTEGIVYKNFYATHLLGPVLVRNPRLLELMCKTLILSKDDKFDFKKLDLNLEEEAYNRYVKKYE